MNLKRRITIGATGLLVYSTLLSFPLTVADDFVPTDEDFNASDTFILDADDTGGDIVLQFGATLAEVIKWNSSNLSFELSDDLSISNDLRVDTDVLFVDSVNDRVGIGITPTSTFHVAEGTTTGNDMVHLSNPYGGGGGTVLHVETQSGNTDEAVLIENDGVGTGLLIQNSASNSSSLRISSSATSACALCVDHNGDGDNAVNSAIRVRTENGAGGLFVYRDQPGTTTDDSLLELLENNSTANVNVMQISNNGIGNAFRVDDSLNDTSPFVIDATGYVGISNSTPVHPLDIQASGTAIETGDGTANDIILNFDDGTDRNFGWDDNYSANHTTGAFSLFNNELAFRTLQSSAIPIACSSTVAGMQWMDTDTGLVYVCDTSNSRNKWLTHSDTMAEGEQTGTCNAGLDPGGAVACSVAWGASLGSDNRTMGLYIPHAITITGYGFSADNDACTSGSFDLEVWSTGSASVDQPYSFEANIATGLDGQAHNSNALNIDIAGGQYVIWGLDNNCGQNIDDYNIVLYYRIRHD